MVFHHQYYLVYVLKFGLCLPELYFQLAVSKGTNLICFDKIFHAAKTLTATQSFVTLYFTVKSSCVIPAKIVKEFSEEFCKKAFSKESLDFVK